MALDVQPTMGFVNQPIVNAGDPIENIDVETQCENSNRNSFAAVHGLQVSQSPNGGTLVVQKDDGVGMADLEADNKHPFKVWWADNVREKNDDNGGFVIYLPPGSATIQVQGGDSLNAYDVTVPKDIKDQKNVDGDTSDTAIGVSCYYLRVGSDYADVVEKMDPVSGDTKTLELYGCIDFDGEFSFHLVTDLSKLGDGRHLPDSNGECDQEASTIIHTFKIADLSIERHEDDEGNPVTTGNVAQQFQFSTVSTDKYNMHPWKLGYSKQAKEYFALNFADNEDLAIHGASSATCPRPGDKMPVTVPFKHARVLVDYEGKRFDPGDSVYLSCLSHDGTVKASHADINGMSVPGLFFSKTDVTGFGEIYGEDEGVRKRWELQSVLIGRLSDPNRDILQVVHSQITFSFTVNAAATGVGGSSGSGPSEEPTEEGGGGETDVPTGRDNMYPFKTWWVSDADPSSTSENPQGALVIYLPPNSIQVTGGGENKHTSNVGGVDETKFELAMHYPQKLPVGAHVYLVKVGCDYKPLNEVFEKSTREEGTTGGGGEENSGSLSAMNLKAGEERRALGSGSTSPLVGKDRHGNYSKSLIRTTPGIELDKSWSEKDKERLKEESERTKAGARAWVQSVRNQFAEEKQKREAAKEAVKKAREERDAAERERKAQRELAKKQAEKAQIEHRIEILKGNVSATEKLLDNAEAELNNYKGDKSSSTYKRLLDNVMTLSATLRQRNDDLHRLENEVKDKEKEEEAAVTEVEQATENEEKKKEELDKAANNKVKTEVRDGHYGAKCLYAALSWDGRITLHIHADPKTSYGCCLMDAGDDQTPPKVQDKESTILYWIPVAELMGCLNIQTPHESSGSVTEYKTYEIAVMQKQIGTYFAGNECDAWHVGKIEDLYETYLAHGQKECIQHEFKGTLDDLPQHEEGAAKSLMFSPVVVLKDSKNNPIRSGLVYVNVCEKNGELYAPQDELGIDKNCWFSSEEDESGSGGGSSGGGSDSSGSGETEYKIHKAPLFYIAKDGILRIENGPVRFCSGGGSDAPQLYDFKPFKEDKKDKTAIWCIYCPSGAGALQYMVDICQFPAVIDPSFIPDPPEEMKGHPGWFKTTIPCDKGQLWLMPSFETNDEGDSAIGVITGTESPLTNVESKGISLEGKLVAYCNVDEKGNISNYTRCCSVRSIFAYMTDTDLYRAELEGGKKSYEGKYSSIDSLERKGHYKGRSYTGGSSALELYDFHKGGNYEIELQATDNKSKYDPATKKIHFDFYLSHLKKGEGHKESKYDDEFQFVTRHHTTKKTDAWIAYAQWLHLDFSISASGLGSVFSYIGDVNEEGGENKSISRRKHRNDKKENVKVFELYNWRSPEGGEFKIAGIPTPRIEGKKLKQDKKTLTIDCKPGWRFLYQDSNKELKYLDKLTVSFPSWAISIPSFPSVMISYIGDANEPGTPPEYQSITRRDGENDKTKVFELYNFRAGNSQLGYMNSAWNGYGASSYGDHCKRLRQTIFFPQDTPGWNDGYYSFVTRRIGIDGKMEVRYVDALSVAIVIPSSLLPDSYIGDDNEDKGYHSITKREDENQKKRVFELYHWQEGDTDVWNHVISEPETFWHDEENNDRFTFPACGDFLVREDRTLKYEKFTIASIRAVLSCGIDKKSLSVEEGQDQKRLGICGWWRKEHENRYVGTNCGGVDYDVVWGTNGRSDYPLIDNSGHASFLTRDATGGVDPRYLTILTPTIRDVLDARGIDHRCLDLDGRGRGGNTDALELYDYSGQLQRAESGTYTIYVEPGCGGGGTSQFTLPWGTNPLTWRKLRIEIPAYPDPGGDITNIYEEIENIYENITVICGDVHYIHSTVVQIISTCEHLDSRIAALESACENRPCEGHVDWDTQTLLGWWNVAGLEIGTSGLNVQGQAIVWSDIYTFGNLHVDKDLDVCGETHLNSTSVGSGLTVACGATVQGDLTVCGWGLFPQGISGDGSLLWEGTVQGKDLKINNSGHFCGAVETESTLSAGQSLTLGAYTLTPDQLSGLLELLPKSSD